MRYMEESNACLMWCPFSRVRTGKAQSDEARNDPITDDAYVATSSFNRLAQEDEVTRISGVECVAGDCMAWRWASDEEGETKGYCGLAGRP